MSEAAQMIATLLAGGLTAGLLGGLLGVGGGVIVVPILHLGLGLPLPVAVGTSLVTITGTSLAGSAGYLKRGLVELRLALGMGLGVLAGAIAASWLAAWVPESLLTLLFSGLLLYTSWKFLPWKPFSRRQGKEARARAETPGEKAGPPAAAAVPEDRRSWAYGLAPVAGCTAGLLGIGGGLVQVPLLRLLAGLDMRRAVATSTLLVGWATSTASAAYWGRSEVDLTAVPPLLAGILVGGLVAPTVGGWLPTRALEGIFSVLLLWAAVRMLL